MSFKVCYFVSLYTAFSNLICSLIAISDAFTKTSRIHRDISLGNIILVREDGSDRRKGYLIDWDASCLADATGTSHRSGRVVSMVLALSRGF